MQTRLIWITPDAEKMILYIARVSNPKKQDSSDTNLIDYCLKEGHVSPFQMANICFEIETSRRISPQILRHRSFNFQEFCQRYAKVLGFEVVSPRRQDKTNRQNSVDDLPDETIEKFLSNMSEIENLCWKYYEEALNNDIAKESAAFMLPETTKTRLYMNGTIRDWIFYIKLRTGSGTQREHIEIATSIKQEFTNQLPIISQALGWKHDTN
jgi:thymidylate synthase (FAD)